MKKILFLSIILAGFSVASCSKDNDNPTTSTNNGVKEIKNLDIVSKKDKEDWIYFSFDKGSIVEITNPAESPQWDIAFFQHYVKTNGGESGKANGGVFKTESKDFNSIKEVSINVTFAKDIKGTMQYGSYPNLTSKEDSFSLAMSGSFQNDNAPEVTGYVALSPKNMPTWPSVYAPTKWVYIVKTASGGYAKIQITDFYNDAAKAGYPTFKYQLSQDGKF